MQRNKYNESLLVNLEVPNTFWDFETHIEFTKARAALVKALTDLPAAPEAIR